MDSLTLRQFESEPARPSCASGPPAFTGQWRMRAMAMVWALLAAGVAVAQNFVRNPDFEEPLGPDNWTIVYTGVVNGPSWAPTNCGPNDFLVAGRTTMAHKDKVPGTWDGHPYFWSKFGGHFAPNHTGGLMHGYFRQRVSGLQPNGFYNVSAWMAQHTRNDNYLGRAQVWMEVLSGPNLSISRRTPYVMNNVAYDPTAWQRYSISNVIASQQGEIEIQLHYNMIQTIAQIWEYRNLNAFYDHVSLMPVNPQPPPPPRILSCVISNHILTLEWETLLNNYYRIETTTNLSDTASWTTFIRNPYVDPDFLATGSRMSFRTNLFANDPAYDPMQPRFFRIVARAYEP